MKGLRTARGDIGEKIRSQFIEGWKNWWETREKKPQQRKPGIGKKAEHSAENPGKSVDRGEQARDLVSTSSGHRRGGTLESARGVIRGQPTSRSTPMDLDTKKGGDTKILTCRELCGRVEMMP